MAGMDLSQLKAFVNNIVLTKQEVYNDAIFRVGASDNINFDEVCLLIKKKIERQAAGIDEDGRLIPNSPLAIEVRKSMKGFVNMLATSMATNVATDVVKSILSGAEFTTGAGTFKAGGGTRLKDIKVSGNYGAFLETGIMGGRGAESAKQHDSTAGADKEGREFKTKIVKNLGEGVYEGGKLEVSTAQVYYKGYAKGSVSTTQTDDSTIRLIFLLWQLIKKMDSFMYMNIEEVSFEAGAFSQVPIPGKFNSKGEPKTQAQRKFPDLAMTATLSIRALTLYTEVYVKALLNAIQDTMRIKITNNGIEEDDNGAIVKWGVVITFEDIGLSAIVNSLSQLYLDKIGYITGGKFESDYANEAIRDSVMGAVDGIPFNLTPLRP